MTSHSSSCQYTSQRVSIHHASNITVRADYLLRYGFGERPAVPSMAALFSGETDEENSNDSGTENQGADAVEDSAGTQEETQPEGMETTTLPPSEPEITPQMSAAFEPLPVEATPHTYQMTDELIDLGRILYYEPRMSLRQDTSCNSCHPLDRYGVDGLPRSFTQKGTFGKRNAPTVYNGALHLAQLWDGRSETVEDQALGPITNPEEMGMPDAEFAEEILRSIPGYTPLFTAAFPDEEEPLNFKNVGIAIGAFERRLVTRDRFDKFLNGDESALTIEEKRGLARLLSWFDSPRTSFTESVHVYCITRKSRYRASYYMATSAHWMNNYIRA